MIPSQVEAYRDMLRRLPIDKETSYSDVFLNTYREKTLYEYLLANGLITVRNNFIKITDKGLSEIYE
jgi:hypothetical protein